ncbi:MAG: hypothetical protein JWO22_2289, partial [Frankiales bacterium]|nr:hypothetical protein [Frankiales bacterium]
GTARGRAAAGPSGSLSAGPETGN